MRADPESSVIVRESDEYEWEILYKIDNVLRPTRTSAVQTTALAAPELASVAASLRSIRWAALVAVWLLIAAVVLGFLLGLAAPVG